MAACIVHCLSSVELQDERVLYGKPRVAPYFQGLIHASPDKQLGGKLQAKPDTQYLGRGKYLANRFGLGGVPR